MPCSSSTGKRDVVVSDVVLALLREIADAKGTRGQLEEITGMPLRLYLPRTS